jgi:hypothetical protein
MECLVKADMIRPVGYGMISVAIPDNTPLSPTDHTVPYGTGFWNGTFQAFHARLPITRSLRDKHSCALMLTRMDSRRMSLPVPYRTDKISLQLQGVLPSYRRQPPAMGGQKIR